MRNAETPRSWTRFLVRRFALLLFVLWASATLVFFFIHLVPGDPVSLMLGEMARAVDQEALRAKLGLDQPLLAQYFRFLRGLLHQDLGESFFYRRSVFELIAERIPATYGLALAALAVATGIALPLGIISALRERTWVDAGARFFALLGISMPSFWLGPLLILLLAIELNWLPVSGSSGIANWLLPSLTLGLALAALLSRMTRAAFLEVIREEYISTARAKGLPERKIVLVHAMKNALIPIITILGLQLGAVLSGAIIIEKIFSWPGIGSLLVAAIEARDYPLVQGCVLAIA
ncbi:MAG: ABC transporter permease, partial [Vicinamibacteria bacterium]